MDDSDLTGQSGRGGLDDKLLPARKVWGRFGVTDRTLDRWLSDQKLGFPKPIIINRRRYFSLCEIKKWERAQASKKLEAA